MNNVAEQTLVGVSAGSVSRWMPVDSFTADFSVGYAIFHASGPGQVSGNLEGTFDDVLIRGFTSARAFFLVTANPSTGLAKGGVITMPINAIRYKANVVSASSNIVFQVLQAGPVV